MDIATNRHIFMIFPYVFIVMNEARDQDVKVIKYYCHWNAICSIHTSTIVDKKKLSGKEEALAMPKAISYTAGNVEF